MTNWFIQGSRISHPPTLTPRSMLSGTLVLLGVGTGRTQVGVVEVLEEDEVDAFGACEKLDVVGGDLEDVVGL